MKAAKMLIIIINVARRPRLEPFRDVDDDTILAAPRNLLLTVRRQYCDPIAVDVVIVVIVVVGVVVVVVVVTLLTMGWVWLLWFVGNVTPPYSPCLHVDAFTRRT